MGHDHEAMSVSAPRALLQLDDAPGLGSFGFVPMQSDVHQAFGGWVCPPAQAICSHVESDRHIHHRPVELRQRLVPTGSARGLTRWCVHMLIVSGLQQLMVSAYRHWRKSYGRTPWHMRPSLPVSTSVADLRPAHDSRTPLGIGSLPPELAPGLHRPRTPRHRS